LHRGVRPRGDGIQDVVVILVLVNEGGDEGADCHDALSRGPGIFQRGGDELVG
jgi:hypothetical protein